MQHKPPLMYKCLLQAEDEPADVHLLKYSIENSGVDLCLHDVHDGQAAIDYLSGHGPFADRATHHFPRLLLLDIKMPRKSGFQVLQWIRSTPTLPPLSVVMFSSTLREQDVQEAYRLGANAFVIKPASVQERNDFVKSLVSFWFRWAV